MSDFLAMGREASQFSADGISVSWPQGGRREVVEMPPGRRSMRIKRMVTEGFLVEVDGPATKLPNKVTGDERIPYEDRLMAGNSPRARESLAQAAGPVVRKVFVRPGSSMEAALSASPERSPWPDHDMPEQPKEPEIELSEVEKIEKIADSMTRKQLIARAVELGVDGPDELPNKLTIAEAIYRATLEPAAVS